jgi:hypothetical protein
MKMSTANPINKTPVSRAAVVALVMAVFQLNIFALIVGIRALVKIRVNGNRGRVMALIAVFLGGIQTVVIILFLINPSGFGYGLGATWGHVQNFFDSFR